MIGESSATSSWNRYIGSLVKGGHQTGGLIGRNNTAVSNSFSTGEVQSNSSIVGGLVGWTYATITGTTATLGSTTYASGNVTGGSETGGLVGYADWTNAVINNTYATGNVSGTNNTGGLVGYLYYYADILNSTAFGNVQGTSSVGGLLGQALILNTITNANANGWVSGTSRVGGLIGDVSNQSTTITNSAANNSVTGSFNNAGTTVSFGVRGTGSFVGGLVGYMRDSSITGSTANTVVIGQSSDVGGLVGRIDSGASIQTSGSWGAVTGVGSVGGLVGSMYNSTSVSSSYANANVTSTGSHAGGFVGYFNSTSNITDSRAAGSVTGTTNVGGFMGTMTISGGLYRSYATGMVKATGDYAGGLIGYIDNGSNGYYNRVVQDVYATGAVMGTTNVGGLVGKADRVTFSNGYSTGMVTSSTSAASVGASFGSVGTGTTVTFSGNPQVQTTTYWVIRNNLYYDSSTSGMSTDAAGGGGTGAATGLATASLLGALPHANWLSSAWGTGTNLYPYLKSIHGASTPQAISGFAYKTDGVTVAERAQVGVYGGGYLLNGGTMTTGKNGFFYELLSSSAAFNDAKLSITSNTKLAHTLVLDGTSTIVGMAYSDTQVLTGNNLVIDGAALGLGKVIQGLTQLRTADVSMTALNTSMDNTMGSIAGTNSRSVFSSSLPTNTSLELTATASAFNLNTSLVYGKTTASNAGLMTLTGIANNGTTFTLSGGTYTSGLTQTYNGKLALGAHATLTGTQVTTSSTIDGAANQYNLTVNGPLTTGGSMSSLGALRITGLATLGGSQVTSAGAQTYLSDVVMHGSGNSFLMSSALTGGANVGITGTLTSSTAAKALTITAGTGDVSLSGAVGGGATDLTTVSVSADEMTALSIDATQAVTLNPITSGTVGLISGASTTLTKGAAGVLNLTAANTYGGNTTISAGTLKLAGASSLTSGSYAADIAIAAGATLLDSSSVDHALSGVISGAGRIEKDTANSVLTLSGNNTFTGSVTVNAGSLAVTHDNSLGTSVQVVSPMGTASVTLDLQAVTVDELNPWC